MTEIINDFGALFELSAASQRGNVDEDIRLAIFECDEAKAFLIVEEFDGTDRHDVSYFANSAGSDDAICNEFLLSALQTCKYLIELALK